MLGIGIIEDDAEIRNALEKYIDKQPDFHCLGAYESVELAMKGFDKELMPDLILTDIELPGMSGIEGIKMMKPEHPDTEFLVLSIYHDVTKIFPALRAGAVGYLLKNTPFPKIREAILEVRQGGSPMSPQIARLVIQEFTGKREPIEQDDVLTQREHEIVIALVDGLSYKMIAARMDISIETVRFHIRNIYKKLQVHSKGEVISKSLRGEI